MCSFLKANLDFLFGDRHLSGGVDQIAKQVSALGGFVAVANAASQQAIETAAMRVSCRSQSTFIATAEESASIWKKSMPSAMLFSMTIRWA